MSAKRTAPAPTDAAQSLVAAKPLDASMVPHLDAIHHAWLVGYDAGVARGQQMAVEHLAHELLHRQAAEITHAAVQTAGQRHGDGWAGLIRDQAQAVA